MTDAEKNIIRNQWCNQLCDIFNKYYKNGIKTHITIPLYVAQVLSTFDILDFSKIDFKESKINFGQNTRSNNEDLIYECFDNLIKEKTFIGDLMVEFRNEFNSQVMPF